MDFSTEIPAVRPEPGHSPRRAIGQQVAIAVYAVTLGADQDVLARADFMASHYYPGAGTVLAQETPGARDKFSGRVLGIHDMPQQEVRLPAGSTDRQYVVHIAIPLEGLGDSFATLLTAVAGELLALGGIRLVDLQLPEGYVSRFLGPKYGAEGIRTLLRVPERPLLMGIFRPCTGFTPEEGAGLFFEAAMGGADIVKDDELLTNPSYCRRAERVALYAQAEQRAYEETGEHTLYAVNITDRVERLLPNAAEAIELGANALMVNYWQVGLDATRWLCQDPRVTVPVLGHNAGTTILHASALAGVSRVLVDAQWPRLAGVDLCILLTAYGKFALERESSLLVARDLVAPLGGIRPVLPVVAGGVSPALVGTIYAEFGKKVAVASGAGVFGHPGGPRSGARAFRQAIRCVLEGRDLAEGAREFPELGEALAAGRKG